MKLFLIVAESDDGELESFVRHTSSSDAVDSWKAFHRGHFGHATGLTVYEVPCDSGVVGVIPWDLLKVEELEL